MNSCREPTLEEMLADPIVQAVMRADGVDRRELDTMLSGIRRALRKGDREPSSGRDRPLMILSGPS